MSTHIDELKAAVEQALDGRQFTCKVQHGELTLEILASDYADVCLTLRDHVDLQFDQLIDLCGIDYSSYGNAVRESAIFGVVLHLLSVRRNERIRVRTICADDDFPTIPSVNDIWSSAAWYEREAFDMYGIVFQGHPDLRRILTDYGFMGHPFRKDFPLSGHVEMRYDPEQKRVIYQPVTIEPREVTPRIIREEQYGGTR